MVDISTICGILTFNSSRLNYLEAAMSQTLTSPSHTIPAYIAGTWDIDPVHSEVSFLVRHMVVSKVRGRFNAFGGTIVTADDPAESSVQATIEASSIDTNQEQRDAHIRSADFLDAEHFPTLSFRSTAVRPTGNGYDVDGELTIRGVTKPVTLEVEVNGFSPDPYGGTRAGFSAKTEINRQDFGVSYNGPIPGADNAMVLSDKVALSLELEAVLRTQA
jgi:polyisoprenoid-binding protein YceI